jgi:hypothetical protein
MSIEIVNFADRSPTDENIRQMVELTAEDLTRGGLRSNKVKKYADTTNLDHLATQREKVDTRPELYTGAYDEETLAAFAKIDEWLRGSQGNFESIAQRMRDKQNGIHLPGEPLGILALNIAKEIPNDDKQEIGHELLRVALAGKEKSEVRIGVPSNDPLKDVLIDHKFEPTGKHGKVLGVKQELYIKPATLDLPKERSEQDW